MKTLQELKKGGRDKTLRAGEAARLLDCSAGSIHRWTTECGLFTAVRTPGGQNVYWRSEVLAVRALLDGKPATQRRVEEAFAKMRGEASEESTEVREVVEVTVRVPLAIDGDEVVCVERPTVHALAGTQTKAALAKARVVIDEVLEIVDYKKGEAR